MLRTQPLLACQRLIQQLQVLLSRENDEFCSRITNSTRNQFLAYTTAGRKSCGQVCWGQRFSSYSRKKSRLEVFPPRS